MREIGRWRGAARTIARLVLHHPLGRRRKAEVLRRFVTWQLGSRLLGAPIALPFVAGSRLLTRTGMTGATGNHYVGLFEFEDMAFVLHALRPDDLFVDVGANVGVYTVLAGAAAGATCLAVEPIPATFEHLLNNVRLNALSERVTCVNVGLGSEAGVLRFTTAQDAVNHVAVPGEEATAVEVPVQRLDALLEGRRPLMVKVDVEGWEAEVLAGAEPLLEGEAPLAVIMELNGHGARYGFDEAALHRRMLEAGFEVVGYDPFERMLTPLTIQQGAHAPSSSTGNSLYVRGLPLFQERVAQSRAYDVLGFRL